RATCATFRRGRARRLARGVWDLARPGPGGAPGGRLRARRRARDREAHVEAELVLDHVRLAKQARIVARRAVADDEVEHDRAAHPRAHDLLDARAMVGVEAVGEAEQG